MSGLPYGKRVKRGVADRALARIVKNCIGSPMASELSAGVADRTLTLNYLENFSLTFGKRVQRGVADPALTLIISNCRVYHAKRIIQ
jgi:hypothetical protein